MVGALFKVEFRCFDGRAQPSRSFLAGHHPIQRILVIEPLALGDNRITQFSTRSPQSSSPLAEEYRGQSLLEVAQEELDVGQRGIEDLKAVSQ